MIGKKKIEEVANQKVPKRLYIIDYQLEPCEIDGISDARLNARPFNTTRGKLVEYLCLDSLWHDASETPKKIGKAIILAELHQRGNLIYKSFNLYNEMQAYKSHTNDGSLARWLYIDDLQKGGK